MMNEFRCWIFAISDETAWEFPVSFDWEFSVRISWWENFPSEDQCTGNSQLLQSGAIILRQRVNIQSAWGGGGHSLIKVTGGGSDTDVFTWNGHSS